MSITKDRKWRWERQEALRRLLDGATTPGEREAALAALRSHRARYGETTRPPSLNIDDLLTPRAAYAPSRVTYPHPGGPHRLGWGWTAYGVQEAREHYFLVCREPRGESVVLKSSKVRKPHHCRGCRRTIEKGSLAYRPAKNPWAAWNGIERSSRFCRSCVDPVIKRCTPLKVYRQHIDTLPLDSL